MPKIVFIGAGSLQFTRNLVRDLLRDVEIALVDISEERLEFATQACEKIIRATKQCNRASIHRSAGHAEKCGCRYSIGMYVNYKYFATNVANVCTVRYVMFIAIAILHFYQVPQLRYIYPTLGNET